MSAAAVLSMMQAEGVVLALEGERLTWQADHQPPAALLAEIKAHRLEIIEALSAVNDCTAPAADLEGSEPARYTLSAATAAPEWIAARDQFYSHLMPCRACHAPTGRYCAAGAELRQRYELTPME
jgi:hypothetical protein